ncbi:hypothetical protein EBT31_20470, partial [bacterium]|nr:hypothetical protein [bacterium]
VMIGLRTGCVVFLPRHRNHILVLLAVAISVKNCPLFVRMGVRCVLGLLLAVCHLVKLKMNISPKNYLSL